MSGIGLTRSRGAHPSALTAWQRCRGAILTIWVVVNLVSLLQALGYLTRVSGWEVQRTVGIVIATLAIPATLALIGLIHNRAGWLFYGGPLAFDGFVALLVVVDYLMAIEWRGRAELAAPMLILFFGSIFLMGVPMFRINRRLWAVTAATTVVLLGAMGYAISQGVG